MNAVLIIGMFTLIILWFVANIFVLIGLCSISEDIYVNGLRIKHLFLILTPFGLILGAIILIVGLCIQRIAGMDFWNRRLFKKRNKQRIIIK